MILSDMLKELEADNKRVEEMMAQRHEREASKVMGWLRKQGFVEEDGWTLLAKEGYVDVAHPLFKSAVAVVGAWNQLGYEVMMGHGYRAEPVCDRLDILRALIAQDGARQGECVKRDTMGAPCD